VQLPIGISCMELSGAGVNLKRIGVKLCNY